MSQPYILLLTSRPDGWPAVRLRSAARELDVPLRTANPDLMCLEIISGNLRVRYAGRLLPEPAVVLPRLGPGNYDTGLPALEHFESMGIPVINRAASTALARDTYSSLLALSRSGLKVPSTARMLSIKDLVKARKIIPGPPWILKTFTGTMGIGTMKVNAVDQLEAVAATIWALNQPILMQEFLHSSTHDYTDTRAFIVGGRVIGAIQRHAGTGEYRANIHKGATSEQVRLSYSQKEFALKAAGAIGLDIAGVDWIDTDDGPVVLEVNATPGFQGFEQSTGIDVARDIIIFAVKLGKIPKN